MYYVFADKQLRNNFFCELQNFLLAVCFLFISITICTYIFPMFSFF